MRWDRLTVKAQEALRQAVSQAESQGHPEVTSLHLLDALLSQREGIADGLLRKLGADPAAIQAKVHMQLGKLPKTSGQPGFQPPLGRDAARVFDDAYKLIGQFKDDYISTEHLIMAIASAKGAPAGEILATSGVTADGLMAALKSVRGTQRVTDQDPEGKYEALKKYGRDLTEVARRGKLDPAMMGAFKTPSLRSVTKTGPWFHDGSAETLEAAVKFLAAGGKANPHLDKNLHNAKLSDKEVAQLIEFLKALDSDEPFEKPSKLPQAE